MKLEPSDAAVIAVRLAEELAHEEPVKDSAWLTVAVVEALQRLLDQEVIAPGRKLRESR